MDIFGLYFLSSFLFLVASYVILRLNFRYDYSHKGRLTLFSIFFGTLIFFLWRAFPYIFDPKDWPVVHVAPLFKIVGWVLLIGGLVIMFAAVMELGLWRTFGQESNTLKHRWLYRLTRNPQVIGGALYGIGFAILWPSWYALGWVAMYAAITHWMVLTEEQHLQDVFGKDYMLYCQRIPRYLKLPWQIERFG